MGKCKMDPVRCWCHYLQRAKKRDPIFWLEALSKLAIVNMLVTLVNNLILSKSGTIRHQHYIGVVNQTNADSTGNSIVPIFWVENWFFLG